MTSNEFKILVCGGRAYSNKEKVYDTLDEMKALCETAHLATNSTNPINIVIIQGGAKGADRLASQWAKENNIRQEQYDADWDSYGKAAGYIRNKTMLTVGKPDLVIAFSGGQGTKNMIQLAQDENIQVEIIKEK